MKTELFSRHNRRRLNTVGAIASEQGKIYRAAASGTLETGEAMRLSCILRELRAALEAAQAAATIDMPAGGFTTEINVYAIPHGVQFTADGQTLIWPETGAPADPLPFTPYEPTPDWTALPRPAPEPSIMNAADVTAIEVELPDDPKITRLNPFRARAGDDPPGAA